MSLINKMLKDLENRDAKHRELPHIAYSNNKPTIRLVPSRKVTMITFGIVLSLLLLTVVQLIRSHHKKTAPLTTFITENIVTPTKPIPLDTRWISPVSINGVTLQVKESITELTFLLNHPTVYRLMGDSKNQVTIMINHAQMQAELPPVNYLNTAINKISMTNKNDDTLFALTLTPRATIKSITQTEDKNPELVISIEQQPDPVEALASETNTSVKMPAIQDLLIQQYKSALSAAENGHYQTAIQQLSSLIKADPNYKDARASLAALLIDQGSATKAEEILDQGLEYNPEFTPFIELKSRLLASHGKTKQALALLLTASPGINDNPEYHALIAAMYEQNHEYSSAANTYKQLLLLSPHNGSWWFGFGVSLDKLGQDHAAIQAYTKAVVEGHLNADSIVYLQKRLQHLQGINGEDDKI